MSTEPTARIEVLVFDGCPHAEAAMQLAHAVAERLGPGISVERVEVDTAERAADLGFLGSPSLRVNGVDVEGKATSAGRLSCRTYEGGAGVPPEWLLEAAVLRALCSARCALPLRSELGAQSTGRRHCARSCAARCDRLVGGVAAYARQAGSRSPPLPRLASTSPLTDRSPYPRFPRTRSTRSSRCAEKRSARCSSAKLGACTGGCRTRRPWAGPKTREPTPSGARATSCGAGWK